MVISRACRSVGPQGGRCLIDGSDEYADYREQLVTWDEYARMVPAYAEQVSLPSDAAAFVAQLRSWLESIPRSTHQSFPGHAGVRIENGEPVLTKLPRKDDPAKLRWLEKTIADRRIIRPQPCNISKQATCSVSSASGSSDSVRSGSGLQIKAKLYFFRMRLKSASFAWSVKEPIDVTLKLPDGRS